VWAPAVSVELEQEGVGGLAQLHGGLLGVRPPCRLISRRMGRPGGSGSWARSVPSEEPLERLPVQRGELVQLDGVHASLAGLALLDEALRPPEGPRGLGLGQAGESACPKQTRTERRVRG